MTHDVTQWLAEIKTLKQQLMETRGERDAAHESATNWRKLYETEAQQRRSDTHLAQQTIASLKSEIQQLQGAPRLDLETPTAGNPEEEIASLQTLSEIKAKLMEVLAERDRWREEVNRLAQILKTEQANHAQTRKSLTTALGDAVDLLNKERAAHGRSSAADSDFEDD